MLLQHLLQARKGGFNLNAPDFGGENIMDIFDAVDGFSFDLLLDGLLPKFERRLSLRKERIAREGMSFPNMPEFSFLPNKGIDVPNLDLSATGFDLSGIDALIDLGIDIGVFDADLGLDFEFSKNDISNMFEDISNGLKPKEVFNFLRGDVDRLDFQTISGLIKNPNIKTVIDEDFLKEIADTCADVVDFGLLADMEKYYDDSEPIGTLCDDLGIDYGISPYPTVKSLADELSDNYQGMSQEDIDKMIRDMLDKLKDNLSDILGTTGNDTPFNEDPDSFMPSPSDIPAMDFVNDIALNAILDPIGSEYKREAASYVDNLMIPVQSNVLVPMYFQKGQLKVKEFTSDYKMITEEVEDDFEYNPDFENYYKGASTPLYDTAGTSIESEILKADNNSLYKENLYATNNPGIGIHVKNLNSELKPPISVIDRMDSKFLRFIDGESYGLEYGSSKIEYGTVTKISFLDPSKSEGCDSLIESSSSSENVPPNIKFSSLVEQQINKVVNGETFLNAGIRDLISYVPEPLEQNGIFEVILEALRKILIGSIADSKLFNTLNLYTMVFDSDEIDLLNLESSKKSAKEDYNEKFSFKEGGESQLSISSIDAVIQLNFKIYIIESFMKACFALDVIYNQEDISDAFCIKLSQAFKSDFIEYPEYIANVESLLDINNISVFKQYLTPLYKEISSKLNLVFETAFPNFINYLESKGSYQTIKSKRHDLPIEIYNLHKRGIRFVGIPYYVSANPNEVENMKNIDVTSSLRRFRLCYIFENGAGAADHIGRLELTDWTNYENYEHSDLLSELSDYETQEVVDTLGSNNLSLTQDSVSLAMKAANKEYFVIPLIDIAATASTFSDDNTRLTSLMSQFVTEYVPLSDIYDLMLLELAYEVGVESPNVLTAFNGTKMLIKKTFDSLENSKDSYDHDDKETELRTRRAFEESGTSPDFSDVAKKMSLQTVPMIAKGLAENFDQNTQLASLMRQGADLAGVHIPAQLAALGIFGAFGVPPNPIGAMYLATGFLEPKERKRIKEMLAGRNTSAEVSSAQEQQQQLLEESAAAREEQVASSVATLEMAIQALGSQRLSFMDAVFEKNNSLYFDSVESEYSQDYNIPKVDKYASDTYIKMTGQLPQYNFYNPSPPTQYNDSTELLERVIREFRDLLSAFNHITYQLINGSYEDDSGNSPFTDKDIQLEIIKQNDFENLRTFIQRSLTQMFLYGETFNALAIMYSNIEGKQLPYESPFGAKSDYSTNDDYDTYYQKIRTIASKSDSKGAELVFKNEYASNYRTAINGWRDMSSGDYYKLYSAVLDFLEDEQVAEWIRDSQ